MKLGIISDTHGAASIWQKVIEELFYDVDLILLAGDILGAGLVDPNSKIYEPDKLAELINSSKIKIIAIAGNCDREKHLQKLNIKIEKPGPIFIPEYPQLNINMYHGHEFQNPARPAGGDEKLMIKTAIENKAGILISGHTHKRVLKKINGVVFINPGSSTLPLSEDKNSTVSILYEEKLEIVGIFSKEIYSFIELPFNRNGG
jgi:putative phosphoesterase